jgi:uncharacterized protein (TIGR00299 family) protein
MNRTTGATATPTGRTAWFQCGAGVAGDMTLAALVDAGADPIEIAAILNGLGVDGWALMFERTQRGGIGATRAVVAVHGEHEDPAIPVDDHHHTHDHHDHDHTHDHHHHDHDHDHDHEHVHRPFRVIRELLEAADLPVRVRARALDVFTALAQVEGHLHGVPTDEVELHEVGALDAIVDIVGVCAALEVLGIDTVVCSRIGVGHGTVRAAHGVIPNPAPATVELLARAGAPTRGLDDHRELATPTGVALMTRLASGFGALPPMQVSAVGYGAGTLDIPGRPNVVQVVIGEITAESPVPGPGRDAVLFEANVDDMTGEVLAHTITALLSAGAHDAWVTPIVMKKGRPAHTVHALCDPARRDEVAATLVAETGTLGLRASTVQRWPQARQESTVDVDGHPIRVKRSAGRVKVEHDDAQIAAAALGWPLRQVLAAAEAAALT